MLYKLPIKVSSEQLDSSSGFTLIEVLVVIAMVGVLSAIAAPSWLGFVARQRLNKANDSIFSALQEAQRQAKKTKLNYSVSLKIDNQVAKILVHPDSIEPSKVDDKLWKLIGEGLEIKSNQIVVGTNLTNKNTGNGNTIKSLAGYKTIAFDYTGALPKDATAPFKIVLATPKSQNSTQPSNLKRCVIVETLIGGMRTATDKDCDRENSSW
ncbi:MAG: prepilin-type N-terminal cleavage/methylation domain-containing protein [Nostocales cyanobacterium 94392]|nr:prepilin-type N-terminal cleavage/methylation domain-containing protein [Nostocales cyanobacterium 94392]